MIRSLLYIISTIFLLSLPLNLYSQTSNKQDNIQNTILLPQKDGEKSKLSAYVKVKKIYISGICFFLYDGEVIKGSIFNEFGISAIDFVYLIRKDKVKICHLFDPLDRWFIRWMMKKNLRSMIHELQKGKTSYVDKRHDIEYKFKSLN